jgi:hypothetical protein
MALLPDWVCLSKYRLSIVLVLFLVAETSYAERNVYRYTNDEGVQVIDYAIPPEYVDKGYEVITYQGEVVTVVSPQMTAEEAEKQKLTKERERKQKEENDHLRKWDERLLLRYSQVSEIVKAKSRALSVIDVAITLNENNLSRLKTDIEAQQMEAAEIERKGEELSETRKATLIAFKDELQLVIDSIDQREKEKVAVAKDYDADIERFKMLRESLDTYNDRQKGL